MGAGFSRPPESRPAEAGRRERRARQEPMRRTMRQRFVMMLTALALAAGLRLRIHPRHRRLPRRPARGLRADVPHRRHHLPEPGAAPSRLPLERLRLQSHRPADHRRHRRDGAAAMGRGGLRPAGPDQHGPPQPAGRAGRRPARRLLAPAGRVAEAQARVADRRQLGDRPQAAGAERVGPARAARRRRTAGDRPGGHRGAGAGPRQRPRELDVHGHGLGRREGLEHPRPDVSGCPPWASTFTRS